MKMRRSSYLKEFDHLLKSAQFSGSVMENLKINLKFSTCVIVVELFPKISKTTVLRSKDTETHVVLKCAVFKVPRRTSRWKCQTGSCRCLSWAQERAELRYGSGSGQRGSERGIFREGNGIAAHPRNALAFMIIFLILKARARFIGLGDLGWSIPHFSLMEPNILF